MLDILIVHWWKFLIVAVASYLVGATNFSIIFSRLIKLKDVRDYGSGNAGTTNMFRVFGLPLGLLTFVCDALKGVLCYFGAKWIFADYGIDVAMQLAYFSSLFCVVGHIFPAYYQFRGGKGLATSIGIIFASQPILALCLIVPLISIILITDRMSVMALTFAIFMIVWSWTALLGEIGYFCALCLTLIFSVLIFAHRHNMVRLFTGKELPTGVRKALGGKKKQSE